MIRKRWGMEEVVYLGEYMVKRLLVLGGQGTSWHSHDEKTETVIVFSGLLYVDIHSRDAHVLCPGQCLTIGAGTVHRMYADVDSTYFEASTPHPRDARRAHDS